MISFSVKKEGEINIPFSAILMKKRQRKRPLRQRGKAGRMVFWKLWAKGGGIGAASPPVPDRLIERCSASSG